MIDTVDAVDGTAWFVDAADGMHGGWFCRNWRTAIAKAQPADGIIALAIDLNYILCIISQGRALLL